MWSRLFSAATALAICAAVQSVAGASTTYSPVPHAFEIPGRVATGFALVDWNSRPATFQERWLGGAVTFSSDLPSNEQLLALSNKFGTASFEPEPREHSVASASLQKGAQKFSRTVPHSTPSTDADAPRLSEDAYLPFAGRALPPFAHTRFCIRNPGECERRGSQMEEISFTAERQAVLARVNSSVNHAIRPRHMDEIPANEKWLIAPAYGDCNDYAVTKRHELLGLGWPAHSLLLAEVVTTWGEHHLVLVVRTKQGDYVADSLVPAIRPWSATDYEWVRVQSPENPKFWASVATERATYRTAKAPRPASRKPQYLSGLEGLGQGKT